MISVRDTKSQDGVHNLSRERRAILMFEYLSVETQSHKTVSITLAKKGEEIDFNVSQPLQTL